MGLISVQCATCIVNVAVLFRLYDFHQVEPPAFSLPVLPPELLEKLPSTDEEWVRLLRAQASRHYHLAQVGNRCQRI